MSPHRVGGAPVLPVPPSPRLQLLIHKSGSRDGRCVHGLISSFLGTFPKKYESKDASSTGLKLAHIIIALASNKQEVCIYP